MRKIILCLLTAILSLSCQAQDSIPLKTFTKADYLKKRKNQTTGGIVLCSAGFAGFLATAMADAGQTVGGVFATVLTLGEYEPEYKSYTGAYVLSGACFAGGIYLFTAASRNKRKARAASITIGNEKTEVLKNNAFHRRSFPAVGVRFRI